MITMNWHIVGKTVHSMVISNSVFLIFQDSKTKGFPFKKEALIYDLKNLLFFFIKMTFQLYTFSHFDNLHIDIYFQIQPRWSITFFRGITSLKINVKLTYSLGSFWEDQNFLQNLLLISLLQHTGLILLSVYSKQDP